MAIIMDAHIANLVSADGRQFGRRLSTSLKANYRIEPDFSSIETMKTREEFHDLSNTRLLTTV